MADREATTEDILAFMDEDERRYWDMGDYTEDGNALPEERVRFWESLESLWRSIPDPTQEELRQLMRPEDWPRTDDDIVLFETTQWFKVEAGANPQFIGTTQPSQFW